MKYLHKTSLHTWYLDHRLTPEVRAMLCAMASRNPLGGIEQRYKQVVQEVEKSLLEELIEALEGVAEDRLTEYPLHPRVQKFFDQFVGAYGHCYDDQTEVLTLLNERPQWVLWKNLSQDSLLGSYSVENDNITFLKPSLYVAKEYIGPMYSVVKDNLDLCVTPNHSMVVSKLYQKNNTQEKHWGAFHKVQACDLLHKTNYRYKKVAKVLNCKKELPDYLGLEQQQYSFGKLCGFFIGDGSIEDRFKSYISFHVKKERKIDFIRTLAKELNIRLLEHKGNHYHLFVKNIAELFRNDFYIDKKKSIPTWVFYTSPEFIDGFFIGLKESDGSVLSKDSWSYSSASYQLLHDIQLLGTISNRAISISDKTFRGVKSIFILCDKFKEPVVNHGQIDDKVIDYNGMVYCATVPTGCLVVRRNNKVAISGNSSVMELTGSPAVYIEGVSWFTNWVLFDSPLCAGQEFSTRAIAHKDWPACYEARNYPELLELHDEWMKVFEVEVAWWTEFFSKEENRIAYGIQDKEPFRPALDRARWALPGTISTGCSQTSNLRERARVLRDLRQLYSHDTSLVDELDNCYRAALPGLSGYGLKEAVNQSVQPIPSHLRTIMAVVYDEPVTRINSIYWDMNSLRASSYKREGRMYEDPVKNRDRVTFEIGCSLAVARDWHRHRTAYPWTLAPYIKDLSSRIAIHPRYDSHQLIETDRLTAKSYSLFKKFKGSPALQALCLPLGTSVTLSASMGVRDFTYMCELRRDAHGANFEYKEQAAKLLNSLYDYSNYHDSAIIRGC